MKYWTLAKFIAFFKTFLVTFMILTSGRGGAHRARNPLNAHDRVRGLGVLM